MTLTNTLSPCCSCGNGAGVLVSKTPSRLGNVYRPNSLVYRSRCLATYTAEAIQLISYFGMNLPDWNNPFAPGRRQEATGLPIIRHFQCYQTHHCCKDRYILQ